MSRIKSKYRDVNTREEETEKLNPHIYLLCEGGSEQDYFNNKVCNKNISVYTLRHPSNPGKIRKEMNSMFHRIKHDRFLDNTFFGLVLDIDGKTKFSNKSEYDAYIADNKLDNEKEIIFAISNPSFEIWKLAISKDVVFSKFKNDLECANNSQGSRNKLKRIVSDKLIEHNNENIEKAIRVLVNHGCLLEEREIYDKLGTSFWKIFKKV